MVLCWNVKKSYLWRHAVAKTGHGVIDKSYKRKDFLEQEDDNLWEGLKEWFIERFLWNRSELRLHYWPFRWTLRAISLIKKILSRPNFRQHFPAWSGGCIPYLWLLLDLDERVL